MAVLANPLPTPVCCEHVRLIPNTTLELVNTLPRVSILGAGPAGFALAADLESRGIKVLLYSHPKHLRHASHVITKGHLKITGVMQGTSILDITSDIREVIEYSKILILTVPSTGQETLLQEFRRFSLHQHIIIAIPGNLFSLIASSEIKARCILETNISPYSCRVNEGILTVFGKKNSFNIAALHRNLSPVFKNEIQRIFPQELRWSNNVIEVSLSNINGVFHPLMILMNAGRIESTGGNFKIYSEGLTKSVAKAILAVDKVRLEVGDAFGFQLESVVETSNRCYGANFKDLVDLARNSEPHRLLKAPAEIEGRNITEDVPDLLVCWEGLARKLGIGAEPLRAVIGMAGMAMGVDFMERGRNLRRLNLWDLKREELLERFSMLRS